uniref:Type VII secretion system protein EssD-like domain-containing protein n=2 Tax=Endopterygota TaxID=33392 RepID=A0A034WJH9_BACDO
MKLLVLFVGLCVSVGVLCSVPDQVEVGSAANPSYSGDVAVQNSIVNDMNERFKRRLPQPSVSASFVKVNRLIKSFSDRFGNKRELCGAQLNRRKRQVNPNNTHCPQPVTVTVGQNYHNDIERIASELRNDPGTITTDVSNENRHAVDSYTTITVPANQNHAQPIDLTVTMQATLTYDNTAQNLRADSIHPAIAERLQEMDWYRGGNRNTNDEQGHLLADSLGGPSLPWNFVPQSPSVNRAVEITGGTTYCWFDLEADIRRILQENQNHYIVWTILVSYGGLPASRRPTGFMISVRHLDSHRRFINYRMFMIPNIPSDACTNSNHAFWRNPIL